MLRTLLSLVSYYLLWILLFFLERLLFILYFKENIFPISFGEFLSTFRYGLRMDASMAGYICALPLLVFIINWLVPSLKTPRSLVRTYSLIVMIVCAILMAVNLNIYQEWGTKLPYRAISM